MHSRNNRRWKSWFKFLSNQIKMHFFIKILSTLNLKLSRALHDTIIKKIVKFTLGRKMKHWHIKHMFFWKTKNKNLFLLMLRQKLGWARMREWMNNWMSNLLQPPLHFEFMHVPMPLLLLFFCYSNSKNFKLKQAFLRKW